MTLLSLTALSVRVELGLTNQFVVVHLVTGLFTMPFKCVIVLPFANKPVDLVFGAKFV
jgi:hypothetical protein